MEERNFENINNETTEKSENVNNQNENNVNKEGANYDWRYGYPDMKGAGNQQYYTAPQYGEPNKEYYGGANGYNAAPQYNQYRNPNPQYQNPNPQNQYPQYNQQPYGNGQQAPFYNYYPQPVYQPKNRIIAGLFGILFGGIGLHNFYLGYTGRAIAQLLVTFFTCGLGSIWGFIEGILIIAGSYKNNLDANGFFTKDF